MLNMNVYLVANGKNKMRIIAKDSAEAKRISGWLSVGVAKLATLQEYLQNEMRYNRRHEGNNTRKQKSEGNTP